MKKIKIYLHPEDFDYRKNSIAQYALNNDCPLWRAVSRQTNFKRHIVGHTIIIDARYNYSLYKFSTEDWNYTIAENVRDCYKADPEMKEAIYYVELTKV